MDAWASGAEPVTELLEEPSFEARVGLSAAHLMGDIIARRRVRRPSFILPNDGFIEGIDGNAAVEVPGLIEDGRATGVRVGRLPDGIDAMVRREVAIQDLAVQAAMMGSRDLALQALLIDPVVHSRLAAEAFLDDVLNEHRAYLPAFWE
jgi:alpha-galactosidase